MLRYSLLATAVFSVLLVTAAERAAAQPPGGPGFQPVPQPGYYPTGTGYQPGAGYGQNVGPVDPVGYPTGDYQAPCGCDGGAGYGMGCGRGCGVAGGHGLFGYFASTCGMPQHMPYYPPMHGYYYFAPYHHSHVPCHQQFMASVGVDVRNPYANDLFKVVYNEYRGMPREKAPEAVPTPPGVYRLPSPER